MPLVSAILPTRGRTAWALEAVESFLAQTHADKELIVLDDPEDRSFPDGLPSDGGLRYYTLDGGKFPTIAAKRNICCRLAHGDIVMHFDSDDWSAPGRMRDQVERLEQSGLMVTGYHSMHFFHVEQNQWLYYYGTPDYAIGTTLAYRRKYWQQHPFNEQLVTEEDNQFVFAARREGQLISVDACLQMAARIHSGNTDQKRLRAFGTALPCPGAFPHMSVTR